MRSVTICKAGLVISLAGLVATAVRSPWATQARVLGTLWVLVLVVSALSLRYARRVPALIDQRVDRQAPKEEGFRITAKSPEVHRIALGVGEAAFVHLAAFIVGLGSVSLALITVGLMGPQSLIALGTFGAVFWVLGLPIAAYVLLQSRRTVVVERERITVRGWLGFPCRLELDDEVTVGRVLVGAVGPSPMFNPASAFQVQVWAGGKRLFVARITGHDAPALVQALRASIGEVRGITVDEDIEEDPDRPD